MVKKTGALFSAPVYQFVGMNELGIADATADRQHQTTDTQERHHRRLRNDLEVQSDTR
jgi:cytochrome c-type biogenesis protein CcmH/NrfG